MIRTRFAPSPTGELHIGNMRSALFSYLFAKHESGEFVLRIEDTDRDRYVEGAVDRIIDSMKWLGIYPDNLSNIVIQSERKDIYLQHALQLVEEGKAYVCECSKERLEKLRDEQEKKKLPPMYDRRCRNSKIQIPKSKIKELIDQGKAVIRFKMPLEGEIVVHDAIRGDVRFNASLLDDQVIIKSDGFPTYHLAAVVDDHEMKISHVIRAEEWLSSTPKHILLYEAFGWSPPVFAHLPMILGPDKNKLSKRHGATSVLEYQKQGYLPEAIINFIVLLGWNPKTEQEEFSVEQLIREFTLENVNKSPAIFDIDKLNNINAKYLMDRDPGQLSSELASFGVADPTPGEVLLVKRGGFNTLKEVAEYLNRLRQGAKYKTDLLIFRKSTKEKTLTGLQAAREKITACDMWSAEELQDQLVSAVQETGLTNGDVFWPVRVALSGEEKSPSPVELALALERTETLKRIDEAIGKLRAKS